MYRPALCSALLFVCAGLSAASLPTVVILSTGGTIASKHDETKGGYVPALTGQDLVAAVPSIRKFAHVRVEQLSNISSSDITPTIWLQLARRANDLLKQSEVAGVVVTHGTNTLEETAYFLDLTVNSPKPVIVVGAQRPASDSDSDGPRNLLDAVRVAVHPEALGKGALVVMNGQINAAREVTKTNTSQVETFRSLDFGQLGVVDEVDVRFYRAPTRRRLFDLSTINQLPQVEIIPTYAGADGTLLRAAMNAEKVGGFVIAGFGLGAVPAGMVESIKQARSANIPVVLSTRVPTGRVFPLAANAGAALTLQRMGCVLSDNLSPQKARILLMLALSETHDVETLQKIFYY